MVKFIHEACQFFVTTTGESARKRRPLNFLNLQLCKHASRQLKQKLGSSISIHMYVVATCTILYIYIPLTRLAKVLKGFIFQKNPTVTNKE